MGLSGIGVIFEKTHQGCFRTYKTHPASEKGIQQGITIDRIFYSVLSTGPSRSRLLGNSAIIVLPYIPKLCNRFQWL